MTTPISVIKSVLPEGGSTSSLQSDIKQAIEDTNDNEYQEESVSLTSSIVSYTQTRDTATFQQYSVIVEESSTGTSFQIEFSADQINWYHPDYSNTTFNTTGVDGVSTQEIGTTSGLCKARYMRVALYNGASNSTIKVITTLLH